MAKYKIEPEGKRMYSVYGFGPCIADQTAANILLEDGSKQRILNPRAREYSWVKTPNGNKLDWDNDVENLFLGQILAYASDQKAVKVTFDPDEKFYKVFVPDKEFGFIMTDWGLGKYELEHGQVS